MENDNALTLTGKHFERSADRVAIRLEATRLLSLKPSGGIKFSCEPVIFHCGHRHPPDDGVILDHRSPLSPRERRLIGAKPREFVIWLFPCLVTRRGDQLADLCPGTGGVTNAWTDFNRRPRLTQPATPSQSELVAPAEANGKTEAP